MTMRVWLVVGGVVVAVVLVVFFAWRLGAGRALIAAARRPVPGLRVIRNMHVWMLIWAWATGVLLTLGVGALARQERQKSDRDFTRAMIMARTDDILRNQLTTEKVEQLARRGAVEILRSCYERKNCPRDLARLVNRVLRVTPSGRIVAVIPGMPPAARTKVVTRGRTVVRERVIERGPATAVKGPKGAKGDKGDPGVTKTIVRHQLDSSAVDAVDNLVHDLEQTVGTLGNRVGSLEDRLAAVLGRLCSLLRICVAR